eukprot:scaffold205523_cov34-Tisochrysis_lutea.AAC.2
MDLRFEVAILSRLGRASVVGEGRLVSRANSYRTSMCRVLPRCGPGLEGQAPPRGAWPCRPRGATCPASSGRLVRASVAPTAARARDVAPTCTVRGSARA